MVAKANQKTTIDYPETLQKLNYLGVYRVMSTSFTAVIYKFALFNKAAEHI